MRLGSRSSSVHLVIVLALVALACAAPPSTASDAGEDARVSDAGTDAGATLDAATTDAASIDAATVDGGDDAALADDAAMLDAASDDAGTDAGSDAGPVRTLVLVGGTATTSGVAAAAVFESGSWSALAPLFATDFWASGGGGVTFLDDGRALAVLHGASTADVRASLFAAGTWSTPASFASAGNATPVVASPGGALVGTIPSDHGASVSVQAFTSGADTWAAAGGGASGADYFNRPALAEDASDTPLVINSDISAYVWSQRVAGTWSGGNVPGVTPPAAGGAALGRSMAALAIPATDRYVVALAATGGQLAVLELEAGVWSTPSVVATDLGTNGSRQLFRLSTLADARVVLTYATSSDTIAAVVRDTGGTWSASRGVPGAFARVCPYGIATAPGIDAGVALELVYATTTLALHVRLLDEASWTWSTPVAITGTSDWGAVHLAASR